MAEFKRSRLQRSKDDEITKKTIFLGLLTVFLAIIVIVFGLPLLIKFSIFLGDAKTRKDKDTKEVVLPPLPPRLVVPFEATNSSKMVITGYAEASVTVELMKNDVALEKVQVTENGDFKFDGIDLDKGENVFSAITMNDKGGSSEQSKTVSVVYNDQPPSLTMSNPSEESLTVDSSDFDIIGQSDKGVSVWVNGHVAMVDNDGKFKLKLQLSPGKNDIEIMVKDVAGNVTKKNISIKYDI